MIDERGKSCDRLTGARVSVYRDIERAHNLAIGYQGQLQLQLLSLKKAKEYTEC